LHGNWGSIEPACPLCGPDWEDEIEALLNGRIDIIMSGMSITKAREVRIAFTEPYLKSGLLAAFRAEDTKKYTTNGQSF